jgi:hypothetical protein
MNERDLRDALHNAMIAAPAPPPMNSGAVLEAARRATRRRRVGVAGAASAAAAVALIAVGAILLSGTPRTIAPALAGGGDVTTTTEPPDNTKPSWPDGQTDRTATTGPRFDKGVQLLDLLTASIPESLRAPTDLKPAAGASYVTELRSHQSQYADTVAGKQIWEYMVSIPIGANGKWGKLLAEVHTAGNQIPGEGCALTTQLWGMGGQCSLITVGGKDLGIATGPANNVQFDQWTSYRHPDGTIVYIAQAKTYNFSGLHSLTTLPLTPQQLAELAMDPKFHLN